MNITYLFFLCVPLALYSVEDVIRPYKSPFKTEPVTAQKIVNGWQKYTTLANYKYSVRSIAFADHDPNILIASLGNTVYLYDITQQEKTPATLQNDGFIISLAKSPSIIACGTSGNRIHLWNIAERSLKLTLRCGGNWVQALDFNPSDYSVLASCSDNIISVWDIIEKSGFCARPDFVINRNEKSARNLKFHPKDKNILAVSFQDSAIEIWDISKKQKLRDLKGHTNSVESLSFSQCFPDILASGSRDGTIRLWDIKNDEERCILSKGTSISSVFFDPHTPHMLAAAGANNSIFVCDISKPYQAPFFLQAHPADHSDNLFRSMSSVCFNPKTPHLLASGSSHGMACLSDISDLSNSTEENFILKKYFKSAKISGDKISQKNKERWLLIGLDHLRKQHAEDTEYKNALKKKIDRDAAQKTLKALPGNIAEAFVVKYKLNVLE